MRRSGERMLVTKSWISSINKFVLPPCLSVVLILCVNCVPVKVKFQVLEFQRNIVMYFYHRRGVFCELKWDFVMT
ncbi:40S ribosomal protein S15a [Iris pallida]|uniref:40S ribosomal protein S15a n=1 Tax=Iris pallida TaxID=29817 RepID=A0AAX6E8B7_IRIPA|nr:40S ribosomal protein S15a [Iris pallida]KAJ6824543.1 40S ribosomal protein S15a [Iris pallida]